MQRQWPLPLRYSIHHYQAKPHNRSSLNVPTHQVLAGSPHSVEALVARAKAHRAAGRLAEALQDLALAHDLTPTNRCHIF